MAELDDLPSFAELPAVGQWFTVSDHIGEPTERGGDRNKCPFLTARKAWKAAAALPAKKVQKFMWRYNFNATCKLCPTGVDFECHLPATKHYDMLWSKLYDGQPIVEAAKNPELIESWLLPDGVLRFNHVHCRIEMCRGRPTDPTSSVASERPVALEMEHQVPVAPHAPPHAAGAPPQPPPPAVWENNQLNGNRYRHEAWSGHILAPQYLPRSNQWFELRGPCTEPTRSGGTWEDLPHLQSTPMFKSGMTAAAEFFVNIYTRYFPGVWPDCKLCTGARGYTDHLGATMHWKTLQNKFSEMPRGTPVVVSRDRFWHEVCIPGGVVRINEMDGTVEMCLGQPGAPPGHAPPSHAPPGHAAPPQPPLALESPFRPVPAVQQPGPPVAVTPVPVVPLQPVPPVQQPGPSVAVRPEPTPQPQRAAPPPPPKSAAPAPRPAPAAPEAQAVSPAAPDFEGAMLEHWQLVHAAAAAEVQRTLEDCRVPADQQKCRPCSTAERPVLFGPDVAGHLLSREHLVNVLLHRRDESKNKQVWNAKRHGLSITLTHWPLGVLYTKAQQQTAQASSSSDFTWERRIDHDGRPYWIRSCGVMWGFEAEQVIRVEHSAGPYFEFGDYKFWPDGREFARPAS